MDDDAIELVCASSSFMPILSDGGELFISSLPFRKTSEVSRLDTTDAHFKVTSRLGYINPDNINRTMMTETEMNHFATSLIKRLEIHTKTEVIETIQLAYLVRILLEDVKKPFLDKEVRASAKKLFHTRLRYEDPDLFLQVASQLIGNLDDFYEGQKHTDLGLYDRSDRFFRTRYWLEQKIPPDRRNRDWLGMIGLVYSMRLRAQMTSTMTKNDRRWGMNFPYLSVGKPFGASSITADLVQIIRRGQDDRKLGALYAQLEFKYELNRLEIAVNVLDVRDSSLDEDPALRQKTLDALNSLELQVRNLNSISVLIDRHSDFIGFRQRLQFKDGIILIIQNVDQLKQYLQNNLDHIRVIRQRVEGPG